MNSQRVSLAAEIRELEELLAAIPEDDVIDRMSLEARLQTVKDLLSTLPATRKSRCGDHRSRHPQSRMAP